MIKTYGKTSKKDFIQIASIFRKMKPQKTLLNNLLKEWALLNS